MIKLKLPTHKIRVAKINGICIGFTEAGGDGVADPALGATDILFR